MKKINPPFRTLHIYLFLSLTLLFQSCGDKSLQYYEVGLEHLDIDNFIDAIEEFDLAIEANEHFEDAYYKRGVARLNIDEFELAIDDFSKVLELNPENTVVLIYRGDAYGRILDYKNAFADYSTILEINPNHFLARFSRGLLYNMNEDYQNALTDFDFILKNNSDHASTYNYRSYSKLKLGMLNEALEDVNRAVELEYGDPMSFRNRALIYLEMDSMDLACLNFTYSFDSGFGQKFGNEVELLMNMYCK